MGEGEGGMGTIGQGRCAIAPNPYELTLEQLIPRWNRLVWWTGIRPMFRMMTEIDLSLAESVVMRSLQRGPLSVAEVGECLYISHSAASRAVDRLVRDGLVSRQENPDDRRQKQLTLTPKGEAMVGKMEGIVTAQMKPLVAALSEEEREQLRGLMARMLTAHAETEPEAKEEFMAAMGGEAAPNGSVRSARAGQ
jgi:DNA-binding MarR family transcriptional regulator